MAASHLANPIVSSSTYSFRFRRAFSLAQDTGIWFCFYIPSQGRLLFSTESVIRSRNRGERLVILQLRSWTERLQTLRIFVLNCIWIFRSRTSNSSCLNASFSSRAVTFRERSLEARSSINKYLILILRYVSRLFECNPDGVDSPLNIRCRIRNIHSRACSDGGEVDCSITQLCSRCR